MKHGFLFALVSALLTIASVVFGGWFVLLLWPAMSFGLVGAAYFGHYHQIFGKRPDGTMRIGAVAILLPYLLCLWTVWHCLRLVTRDSKYDQLADNILIGRRLLSHEVPEAAEVVVDLTCEFPECAAARAADEYISFPILDAAVRSPEALASLGQHLSNLEGTVYIHCAQGYGRTSLIAALLLIARGQAQDADDALRQIQAVRPRAGPNPRQWAALQAAVPLLSRER